MWDVEGVFTDHKTTTYREGDRQAIPAGVPLHGLCLRVTFDAALKIHEAMAAIDHAPFAICPLAAPLADLLIGRTIGRGFMAEARRIMGGAKGCTHLLELLGEVAATACQTLHDAHKDEATARRKRGKSPKRPPIIDTCHALRADGPVVRQKWPEFAEPPQPGDT